MRKFPEDTNDPLKGKKAKIRLVVRRIMNLKDSVFVHWKPVGLGLVAAGLASFAPPAYASTGAAHMFGGAGKIATDFHAIEMRNLAEIRKKEIAEEKAEIQAK